MGDNEFEDFINKKNPDHSPLECQKKLLFDIIQQRMENSTNLIGIFSNLHIEFPKHGYNEEIEKLKKISETSFDQLDYLMSLVFDEINGEEDESHNE
jgi:hypothetical protein